MKANKANISIYIVLIGALGLAVYYGIKANSLGNQLKKITTQQKKVEQTIATNKALVQIDSMLLQDNYSGVKNALKKQNLELGSLDKSSLQLRLEVVNKFEALKENLQNNISLTNTPKTLDSTDISKSTLLNNIRTIDSLRFALEKRQVQISRLKQRIASKATSKYLTFKSAKGSDVHYVGAVQNNKANGAGLALLSTGSRYEGEWKDNKYHGQGTFFWADGEYYIGNYEYNKRTGKGIYHWPNGDKYVGNWNKDQRSGKGIFYSHDGKVINGIWKKDKLVESIKNK
ncbi:hypothetical protein [uncultured Maribacter sp.]|uniref:MORN repeat-containing protein n=1 Tax=uncultured Maribacter sp. TaxID=431308 RepID=UPI0026178BA7|nr:hypothetical protein [uncultured Maribacter sp.]